MWVWSKLSSVRWRDAWEERFFADGQTNAVITELPGGKTIRVEVYAATEKPVRDIAARFGGRIRRVHKESWHPRHPEKVQPLKVRDRLLVLPTDDTSQAEDLRRRHPGRPVLQIPATLAFGTGGHPTTATCLRLLADTAAAFRKDGRQPWSMADGGTGTGILALAARVLGADPVCGFDHDAEAVRVARSNAILNRIGGVSFHHGDATTWKPDRQHDLVAANLFSDILVKAMPRLARALAPHGVIIVSGILEAQANEVVQAATAEGIALSTIKRTGKWVTASGGFANPS